MAITALVASRSTAGQAYHVRRNAQTCLRRLSCCAIPRAAFSGFVQRPASAQRTGAGERAPSPASSVGGDAAPADEAQLAAQPAAQASRLAGLCSRLAATLLASLASLSAYPAMLPAMLLAALVSAGFRLVATFVWQQLTGYVRGDMETRCNEKPVSRVYCGWR